jgi:hypothetical protein
VLPALRRVRLKQTTEWEAGPGVAGCLGRVSQLVDVHLRASRYGGQPSMTLVRRVSSPVKQTISQETATLATLADSRLRATPDQLRNAFGATS